MVLKKDTHARTHTDIHTHKKREKKNGKEDEPTHFSTAEPSPMRNVSSSLVFSNLKKKKPYHLLHPTRLIPPTCRASQSAATTPLSPKYTVITARREGLIQPGFCN